MKTQREKSRLVLKNVTQKTVMLFILLCGLLLISCGSETVEETTTTPTDDIVSEYPESDISEINTSVEADDDLQDAIIISDGEEQSGTFDGEITDGYASGSGVFFSTNSSGYSYELHATFVNGYVDGESELLFENGNYVFGNYDMGIKNGTFTFYEDTIGEFSEYYESGERIGDTKYIKVNDSFIYAIADELLQSENNPANWSDNEIGIEGITDISSDKYKTAITNWQNKVTEYEDVVFQSCADIVGMTKEEAETAYLRYLSGENSYTEIKEIYPVSETDSDNNETDLAATSDSLETSLPDTITSDTATDTQSADIPQTDSSANGGNGENFNTYDNPEQQDTTAEYVLNTNTMKIHYPSCSSVAKIAPQNYATSNQSVEELLTQGYSTCGICFK